MTVRRIIVAISGASGTLYGVEALRLLREMGGIETHLIVSPSARRTMHEETDLHIAEVEALADHTHGFRDIGAPPSSG